MKSNYKTSCVRNWVLTANYFSSINSLKINEMVTEIPTEFENLFLCYKLNARDEFE